MRTELEARLFEKYPKILNGALVGKHIDCGDGWFHLLDHLCKEVQEVCDENPSITQVQAFEVKTDPTGGLRFYYLGGNRYIWKAILDAETRSYSICEKCGDLCKEHKL